MARYAKAHLRYLVGRDLAERRRKRRGRKIATGGDAKAPAPIKDGEREDEPAVK